MPVNKCMICDNNLGHEHGNRKTCLECQEPSEHDPTDIWIQIKNKDLKKLEHKANIGREIEKLPKDAREIVEKLLIHWRFLKDGI
jgi:hypothetical protein